MEKYWIWLSLRKLSERQRKRLAETVTDPQELFRKVWLPGKLPEEMVETLNDKDLQKAEAIWQDCLSKDVRVIGFADAGYPPRLRSVEDAPVVLYCAGAIPDWEKYPFIGVVGTRQLSGYGENNALRLGRQIADCNGIVVSGMASGVDALAMDGALATGKPVIGVLGTGVDICYPMTNKAVYDKTKQQGCLLSEYPPGTKARPWQFPRRNRIISGISNAVLVVEAPAESGALITAAMARDHGRDVYTVPGGVGLPNAEGSNRLLQEGATAVLCGWDLMRDYESLYSVVVKAPGSTDLYQENRPIFVAQKPKIPKSGEGKKQQDDKNDVDKLGKSSYSIPIERPALTPDEELICSYLSQGPKDPEALLLELDMPSAKALKIITKLTLTGVVVSHPGGGISLK